MQQQDRPNVERFSDLIRIASKSRGHSYLLMVLVRVDGQQDEMLAEHGGGSLSPVMANVLELTPATRLAAIVADADQVTSAWQLLMTAVVNREVSVPDETEQEMLLTRMAEALETGDDLSPYLFFDRLGDPVHVEASH